MMVQKRIFYYSCDHCGNEFNHPRDPSINIPNLNIKQFSAHFAYPHRQSNDGNICWRTQPIIDGFNQEFQFCNEECLAKWVGKKLRMAQQQCARQILEGAQPVQVSGRRMQIIRGQKRTEQE